MKKRSRLLSELTENCWAIYPEQFSFMLNFLLGNVAPDKALAEEMRERNKSIQEANSGMIGNTGIAYIPLMGTIYPRANAFTEMCGGISLTDLTKQLVEARDDDNVKGIIFDVDGPGGAATGVNEFSNILYNSRGSKPIYAYVGGTAASATYWITSAVDKVVADATARVGSVGTVIAVPKKGAEDGYLEITNSMSPFKRPDIEDKEHYKNIVGYLDDMTDVFYTSLARNFGVEKQHVIDNFGRGGMKVGKTALDSKMVHEIGSFASTVESMLDTLTSPDYKAVASGKASFFDMGGRVDSINKLNVNAESSEVKGGFMDIKELREKHPNLVTEIEVAASATAIKASEEKMNAVLDLAQKNDIRANDLVKENEELRKQNKELEKNAMKAKTEAAKSDAHAIFLTKMADSIIPETLHAKVEKQVSFADFLNEEGNLNKEKYTEAVASEISDWEASFTSTKEIKGVVTTTDEKGQEDNSAGEDKEIDETVERLLGFAANKGE